MNEQWRARLRKFWLEFAKPILVVLIVLSSFRSAIADWYVVPTGSMKPTIIEGDRIFVNKLAYDLKAPFVHWRLWHWAEPMRGDIVVFYPPGHDQYYVKRVVGVPGDQIELLRGVLYVNGQKAKLDELDSEVVDQIPAEQRPSHEFSLETIAGISHPIMRTPESPAPSFFGPVVVPEDTYFMMGDNRDNSLDSRYFGFVPEERIAGKAKTVVVSLNPGNYYLPRLQRFLRGMQ